MNEEQTTPQPSAPNGQSGVVNALLDQVLGSIDKVDEEAAKQRVAELRQKFPDATSDELAERLIQQRCMQAGTVGAVTSGATIIPGLGTVATLIFGVATDLRMTYQIQSELVLEMAAVYGRAIQADERRFLVALVTGLSAGANRVVTKAGTELAEVATKRLAQRAVAKSIPFLGVAASGGINMLSTYMIGRRAQAYFSQDPALLVGWDDHVRTLTGVDERKLTSWLTDTTERSWRFTNRQAQTVAGGVIVAGQAAGKIVLVAAGQAGEAAVSAGSWLRQRTSDVAKNIGEWREQRRRKPESSTAASSEVNDPSPLDPAEGEQAP